LRDLGRAGLTVDVIGDSLMGLDLGRALLEAGQRVTECQGWPSGRCSPNAGAPPRRRGRAGRVNSSMQIDVCQ